MAVEATATECVNKSIKCINCFILRFDQYKFTMLCVKAPTSVHSHCPGKPTPFPRRLRLRVVVDKKAAVLARSPLKLQLNGWHSLQVAFDGPRVVARVETPAGETVKLLGEASAQQGFPSDGAIGLSAYNCGGVAFDEFELSPFVEPESEADSRFAGVTSRVAATEKAWYVLFAASFLTSILACNACMLQLNRYVGRRASRMCTFWRGGNIVQKCCVTRSGKDRSCAPWSTATSAAPSRQAFLALTTRPAVKRAACGTTRRLITPRRCCRQPWCAAPREATRDLLCVRKYAICMKNANKKD